MLESPELLQTIFDFCDMRTLVKISSVNRFFEAKSAPMIYRTVDLTDHYSYGMYGRTLDISSGGEETTPSPRQIKNMSYARALGIQAQHSTHNLSSCSFAGVEILFLEGPTTYFDQATQPLLAELATRSISKCPDLTNSTIVDREGVTLGVAYTPGEHSIILALPG